MLSGPEIVRRMELGEIVIDPFVPSRVNPNSVNLSLSNELLMYVVERTETRKSDGDQVYHNGRWVDVIDMKRPHPTTRMTIPHDGFIFRPDELYLGCTIEFTRTVGLVPQIEGRSGIGRLGATVHLTAGFGDDNFCGDWTLEITTVYPLRVYAGVQVCQIAFEEITGLRQPYNGKYQHQRGPKASQIWKEFLDHNGPP